MEKPVKKTPSLPSHILVIGAASTDIVGLQLSDTQSGSAVPARIRISSGGVGRNVAENLALLGEPVALISCVGNDTDGKRILDELHSRDVDCTGVMISEHCSTGWYMAMITHQGGRLHSVVDQAALTHIDPAHLNINEMLFKEAKLIFCDTNLSPEVLREVFRKAKKYGSRVCLDTTSSNLSQKAKPYLKHIHLLFTTPEEAKSLLMKQSAMDDPVEYANQLAHYLIDEGINVVIIEAGNAGFVYASSELSGHIPAVHVPACDPIGSGDAFTAAVLYSLVNEVSIEEAIRLGVSASTLTLNYPGSVHPELTLEKLYDNLVI
jgi:pseudouridine kinase